jgi:hypothetical protein
VNFRIAGLLVCLTGSAVASGANIFNVTGSPAFSFGNGLLMEGWTQAATYSNVSISMPLADGTIGGPIVGVQGTVYLMNAVGPGTTAANEVAPPVTISGLTATSTPRTVFSGLTLPPGNYYVVWAATSETLGLTMAPQGSQHSVVTPGTYSVALGSVWAPMAGANPFPPATNMNLPLESNIFIDVTGDFVSAPASSVPALGTPGLGVLMLGLAGSALFLLRQRAA